MTVLLVIAGAALGAPLRMLATAAATRAGRDAALGTLVVNVVGSAVLGLLLGAGGTPAWVVALFGTGFSGALTTFSTFGADVVRLTEARHLARALAYVAATLVLGLGAAVGAYVAVR